MGSRGPADHSISLDRSTPPQATRIDWLRRNACCGAVLTLLVLGCGRPAAEPVAAPAGGVATSAVSARGGESLRPADPARQLLDAMVGRYRTADAYSDDARVRLSYRRDGEPYVDEAPLTVAFARPGRVHVRAYAAEIAIAERRLQARLVDPVTNNMDSQRLERAISRPTITLADIYSDPTLTHFATAGLGGPAPQLELLMSDEPLAGLFDQSTKLHLDPPKKIDGSLCDLLRIETDQLTYTLWIERETLLLRRVELPPAPTGLPADPQITDVRLSIELTAAAFAVPSKEQWQLPATDRAKVVAAFIPPPPPLASPYLGRQLPKFQLLNAEGQAVVSETGSDRDFTVMLWIADHPASQMAARQLQAVADQLDAKIAERTRFLVIMAEASPEGDEASTGGLLRDWNVGLAHVNDSAAVGRDVFDVREAPTLCVLGDDGQMHWFFPRVGPEMAEQLTAVLTDLARGIDVGGELRKRYEADQQTYRQLLHESAQLPPPVSVE